MSEPATKKQYWCMFCSYRGWYEVKGGEFRSCPRCGNGLGTHYREKGRGEYKWMALQKYFITLA